MKIIVDIKLCYGCKMCEILCSYHKRRFFSLNQGAIRVYKDHQSGEIYWTINTMCDDCKEEEQPLCIKYCPYGALLESKK